MDINAQELRIGNLVSRLDLGDNSIRVESVLELRQDKVLTTGPISVNCLYSEISPIPLTEEWLLKFGFTLDIGVGVWFSSQKHFPVWAAYGDKPYQYAINYPSDNVNINTVHQLQNLFFILCGEELTI